jgi:DNA polymerase-1
MMLEYRQLTKLKSTYIDTLPKLVNKSTGRIHTTYNQTIASTGRLSSTDPNLQNIPIRTELGKEIRRAFVPKNENLLLLSADYSQVELRIMAHICQDDHLIDAFVNGLDIHAATAAILFDKKLDEVNNDMRRVAKTVNFGIMYGLGSFGLSQRLGLTRSESQSIINNYFRKYPGIRRYIDETIENTKKTGYTETLCGRRRHFPDINSKNRTLRQGAERAAINMPIQGTASDMMKIAMINIDKAVVQRKYKSLIILQVHDELVFECYPEELAELELLVKKLMEEALPLGRVPVLVETGKGKNWFEAH